MIGDVLLSSILCEALKKMYPNSIVDYLIYSNTKAVVEHNPYIDNIIEFTNEQRENKLSFFKFMMSIRKNKYSKIYDAYGKLESNLICLFSGSESTISYYKKTTKFCYSNTIKRKSNVLSVAGNAVENRLRLLYKEDDILKNIIRPKIYITSTEKNKALNFLRENNIDISQPIFMIGILGSSIDKSLPYETMGKIIDRISLQKEGTILFNYIPNQINEVQSIYSLLAPETKKKVRLDVYAKSLRDFLALLTHCTCLIGNEGGAVNMAKALNIPTFTIFSPWIRKEVWNMFDDDLYYTSVHLSDYKPEIYNDVEYKSLKNEYNKLYQLLSFEYFEKKLKDYLSNF